MKPYIGLDQINRHVYEATSSWQDYLNGNADWCNTTLASHVIFTGELKTPWSPIRLATADELEALRQLSKYVDIWQLRPFVITRRSLLYIHRRCEAGVEYLKESCGVDIHIDTSPWPQRLSDQPPGSFQNFTEFLNHSSTISINLTGGLPAGAKLTRPKNFVVKANSKTGQYYGPEDPDYNCYEDYDLWFTAPEAAAIALWHLK